LPRLSALPPTSKEQHVISFEPTEDQAIMKDAVAQFARASLSQRARQFEQARGIDESVRRAAHEMGLGTIALPEACGGQELGMVTAVMLEEELGRADAAAAFGLPGPGAMGFVVTELASSEQQQQLIAPYCDASAHDRFGAVAWSEEAPHPERPGFCTTASKTADGWHIRGSKVFVTNAQQANDLVVFAQVDPAAGWNGIAAFYVSAAADGVTLGARHGTLGLDAASFGRVDFDLEVPASARLVASEQDFTSAVLRYFCKQALIVAARAVGLSHSAFELAREYCDTRTAFGKPIGHFQAVAFNLADRLMDVESSRWQLWRAAWHWDSKKDERRCLHASAQAVAHALEATMRCADDCVSLHGGMGFIRDALAEKYMRDAKQIALCCPTVDQLDQLAAAIDLGGHLDPALLLPTPETQAIFT